MQGNPILVTQFSHCVSEVTSLDHRVLRLRKVADMRYTAYNRPPSSSSGLPALVCND